MISYRIDILNFAARNQRECLMQIKCEEMIREVDDRIAAIDLNGNHIIRDCKTMLIFLKEKLTELKVFVQSEPFGSDTEEIAFFKQYKPRILGPLF